MGRKSKDVILSTRGARARLKSGRVYWRQITRERQLGYRPNLRTGTWCVRQYLGKPGTYRTESLAAADDQAPADGVKILDYDQALARAQEWYASLTTLRPYSVGHAIADYLSYLESRGSRSVQNVRSLQSAHLARMVRIQGPPEPGDQVLVDKETSWVEWNPATAPHRITALRRPLCRVKVSDLSAQALRNWRHSLVTDGLSPQTANRMFGVLRAALNRAYRENRSAVPSDQAWHKIEPLKVPKKPIVWYSAEEARKIIDACEPDFGRIAYGSLLTGARYEECCRLNVGDFILHPGEPRLRILAGKGNKSRIVYLDQQGIDFFSELVRDRNPDEPMFLTSVYTGALFALTDAKGRVNTTLKAKLSKLFSGYDDLPTAELPESVLFELLRLTELPRSIAVTEEYRRWRRYAQVKRFKTAARRAGVHRAKQGFHDLRRTYASLLVSAGVSLKVVAEQLGHSDTRMVEKYYGELAKSARAQAVRSQMPSLLPASPPPAPEAAAEPPPSLVQGEVTTTTWSWTG